VITQNIDRLHRAAGSDHQVAGLPALTLEHGGRLAIVTKGETPYDEDAEVRLSGEVDAELTALVAALARAGGLPFRI
jgi:NAD-dependent SIR2 family protein deacetylase